MLTRDDKFKSRGHIYERALSHIASHIALLCSCQIGLLIYISLTCMSCEDTPQEVSSAPLPTEAQPLPPLPDPSCVGYFGQPNAQSGLDERACNTSCVCALGAAEGASDTRDPDANAGSSVESSVESSAWSSAWSPAWYSTRSEDAERALDIPLFEFSHSNAPAPLSEDPYLDEAAPVALTEDACVISVDLTTESYSLETQALSEAPPALITHLGPCGACSSLRDLKVYIERVDLTEPVRACGLRGFTQGQSESVECLRELGFSEPCAMIWYFNTVNTRARCLDVCLAHLRSPYVNAEGALNPCLACDEEESGPLFKLYAGRTRRNSGIPSAICRPCESVSPISHSYLTLSSTEARVLPLSSRSAQ